MLLICAGSLGNNHTAATGMHSLRKPCPIIPAQQKLAGTPAISLRRRTSVPNQGSRVLIGYTRGRAHHPSPPLVTSLEEWAYVLLTHTHEAFASLVFLYKDHSCLPCEDASSMALIRPSYIKHYICGWWQRTLEIQ
jgi:hypothetical protein